jgi:hypothetical protein
LLTLSCRRHTLLLPSLLETLNGDCESGQRPRLDARGCGCESECGHVDGRDLVHPRRNDRVSARDLRLVEPKLCVKEVIKRLPLHSLHDYT